MRKEFHFTLNRMKGQVLREGIQEDSERYVLRFTYFRRTWSLYSNFCPVSHHQMIISFGQKRIQWNLWHFLFILTSSLESSPYSWLGRGSPTGYAISLYASGAWFRGGLCRSSAKQNITSSVLAKAILAHNRTQASLINCLLSPLHQKTIEQQGAPRFCGHFLTNRVFLSFWTMTHSKNYILCFP